MSKKKPTSEVSREMREAAAKKSAKQPKGKKQPAPAKPKPSEKPKKVAKGKKGVQPLDAGTALAPLSTEQTAEAKLLLRECRELVNAITAPLAVLDAKMQQVRDTGAWRAEYASYAKFLDALGEISHRSRSTVRQIASLQLALPEATPEERSKVPRRVAAKVGRLKKKGKLTEKIKKSATKGGKEFDKAVKEEGVEQEAEVTRKTETEEGPVFDAFEPKNENIISDTPQTHPYNPRAGGSGVVEGAPESAQQYDSVVQEAIKVCKWFCRDEELSDSDALKRICGAWLNTECAIAELSDMTNIQAFDHSAKVSR